MKTKIYVLFTLLLALTLLSSCGDDEMISAPFKHSVNLNMDNFNNMVTVVESPNAHSGKKICHLDSGQNYGFFYSINVHDSLIGKEISILVDSWVRTGKVENKCGLVCTVTNNKDSILTWQAIDADDFIKQPNEWSNLNGKFILPGNLIKFGSKINVMCYNAKASSYFDVDDLNVAYSENEQNYQ